MAVHGTTRHVEANVTAACTALFGADQGQVDGIGHKIGFKQQTLLLAFATEVIRLTIETVGEVVLRVEHKVKVFVQVDNGWAVGHRHKPCSVFAGTIEVLVHAVQRNGKQSARLPFKGNAMALVVPNRGGTATRQHINHLFKDLTLWLELFAGCNFTHIAVVGRTRCFVVDVHTFAAATCPRFQINRVQAANVMGTDDVQTFVLHPAGIGCFFFCSEFGSEVFRYECVFCHVLLCFICNESKRAHARPQDFYLRRYLRMDSPSNLTEGSNSGAFSICSKSFKPQYLKMRLMEEIKRTGRSGSALKCW